MLSMARTRAFNTDKVLGKALDLFWRQGYAATSMQDLTEAMSLSRSSLYETYGDKHALFLRALDSYQGNEEGKLCALLDQAESPRVALQQFFDGLVMQLTAKKQQYGCFMLNSGIELGAQDPEVASRFKAAQSGAEILFMHVIERGQVAGQISKRHEPRALARYLFNAVRGMQSMAKANPDVRALREIAEMTLAMLD